MQNTFKYIVIDSPPIFPVTDALILSRYVDGVVLVVHGSRTSKDAVKKAERKLSKVGGKFLGALINNVNINGTEYTYYYDYSSYYDEYEMSDSEDSREVL